MSTNTTAKTIYLSDYQVPDFVIEKTDLVFSIEESITKVTATLLVKRNPLSANKDSELVLHGQELELHKLSLDGRKLAKDEYRVDATSLTVSVPDHCIITCTTLLKPQHNTSLEGLYQSGGMYCTQCEAEGFRKITYYLDRPDVMSEFSTKIIADKTQYPLLLSNGNLINQGELDNNRHWVQWHDPFKKPAYLFALVAANLDCIEDHFTTMSGRDVLLRIYVEAKDIDKCDHAMASLKQAMQWDEQVYGREYDLDIFMIVAVDDFNMGAMENKGLNIFNTSCVLAKPETTTDIAFQRVEGVVAHEYFHNWSGNRVTCRDWFQLSLKEGFTVFRDAQFSADMGSHAVKRIEDVTLLRTLQFAEDAGPMAHPVQPASFIEISNFYTLTIYEKGAEVVRMLHTLLGADRFREGSDLYFQRHDSQAVTINDFVAAMEAVSGRDLTQFKYWYTQAGTPVVTVTEHYDPQQQRYSLHVTQSCPDTPEAKGEDKQPFHFPLLVGLIGSEGELPLVLEGEENPQQHTSKMLELTEQEQTFNFVNVTQKPVASLLRNFSAPVRVVIERKREDYAQLLRYDTDAFSRWDASQQLAVLLIKDLMQAYKEQREPTIDPLLINALSRLLQDPLLDKAMLALLLTLPSEAYLVGLFDVADIDAIYQARHQLEQHLAKGLQQQFAAIYHSLNIDEPYSVSAQAIAKRSLKNTALHYLLIAGDNDSIAACQQQFLSSNNMTDTFAALKALVHSPLKGIEQYQQHSLDTFYEKWQHEPLVVNQWLSVQASTPNQSALARVKQLIEHDCFSIKNPNKVRALIGAFTQNVVAFHQPSGEGYQFLADNVIALDRINPQIAARIITPLTRWRKYDEQRQGLMKAQLERINNIADLSKDVYEIVSKSV